MNDENEYSEELTPEELEYYHQQQVREDAEAYNTFANLFNDALKAGIDIPPPLGETLQMLQSFNSPRAPYLDYQLYQDDYHRWVDRGRIANEPEPESIYTIRAFKAFLAFLTQQHSYQQQVQEERRNIWETWDFQRITQDVINDGQVSTDSTRKGYTTFTQLLTEAIKNGVAVLPLPGMIDIYNKIGPWTTRHIGMIKQAYQQQYGAWLSTRPGCEKVRDFYTIELFEEFLQHVQKQIEQHRTEKLKTEIRWNLVKFKQLERSGPLFQNARTIEEIKEAARFFNLEPYTPEKAKDTTEPPKVENEDSLPFTTRGKGRDKNVPQISTGSTENVQIVGAEIGRFCVLVNCSKVYVNKLKSVARFCNAVVKRYGLPELKRLDRHYIYEHRHKDDDLLHRIENKILPILDQDTAKQIIDYIAANIRISGK